MVIGNTAMDSSANEIWEGNDAIVSVLHSRAAVATQVLITSKEDSSSILVDVGDGCLRDLVAREFNFDFLQGVLFTHTHYDHCSGLLGLLSFLTVVCRRKWNLPVFAPVICTEMESQVQLWRDVFGHRQTFDVEHHRLVHREAGTIGNFQFTAHEAAHPSSAATSRVVDGTVEVPASMERAVFYRMQVGREKLLICVDSGTTDELLELAQGVDLALVEATLSTPNEGVGRIHMTEIEARAVGARASSYILVHRGIDAGYFSKLTDQTGT